jgi:hypothetical protein
MRATFGSAIDFNAVNFSIWALRTSDPTPLPSGQEFWGRTYDGGFVMNFDAAQGDGILTGYGIGIESGPPGILTGTLQALAFNYITADDEIGTIVQLDRINVQATLFDAAIKSTKTTDDLALFRSLLTGDDRLVLSRFADRAEGLGGDDWIAGKRGGDVISGGSGADTLMGGKGADTLQGNSGRDRLEGDTGQDALSGGKGADSLTGGSGDDVLRGGTGADTISGGAGDDTLTGGSGADVFRFKANHGNDEITAFTDDVDRIVIRMAALQDGDSYRINLDPLAGGDTRITVDALNGMVDQGITIIVRGIDPLDLQDDVLLSGL